MAKEIIKHRREDKKKPTLSLKERRAKKHEKKDQRKRLEGLDTDWSVV